MSSEQAAKVDNEAKQTETNETETTHYDPDHQDQERKPLSK